MEKKKRPGTPWDTVKHSVAVGGMNTLRVVKKLDFGIYLDGGTLGEILMPREYVPEGCETGMELDVFIYLDSEDRLLATNKTPRVMAGELAYLKAVAVNDTGAFLDWGLPKDLLVPFREQREKMVAGKSYLVYAYLDTASKRLAASSKIHKFIAGRQQELAPGQQVDLVVADPFDLGHNVIINRRCLGVVYNSEVFRQLRPGQRLPGFIKKIRDDGKVDVTLQQPGGPAADALQQDILQRIKDGGGILDITDSSSPDVIYRVFKVSKKAFKRAVGMLYRQRLIVIGDDGLRLKQ